MTSFFSEVDFNPAEFETAATTGDGAMATLVEDWIVNQLLGLTHNGEAIFKAATAEPWPGSLAMPLEQFASELLSGTHGPVAKVRYVHDMPVHLEAGEQRLDGIYEILVAVRIHREAEARRGNETSIGTNGLRDLVQMALHNKCPAITNGKGMFSDAAEWMGCDLILNSKNMAVVRGRLKVTEVPKRD